MSANLDILRVEKLTMRFGGITAVSGVDLAVEEGQIFSVIGPNGAGKTTVFNAVTGIYEPTGGEVLFKGRPLVRPFTPKVVAGAVAVGLLAALFVALFAVNVNGLWKRAIRDTEAARSEALARNRPGSPVRGNRRTGPGDDLVRAPVGRTLAYAVIGFVVMVAGLGAIVNN